MSRILPSTLVRQQSFSQHWLTGKAIDIPSGLIIGIQVTTDSAVMVALGSITTSDKGELSMSLVVDGKLAAHCSGVRGSSIESLVVVEGHSILSATIETGHITRDYTSGPMTDVYISPEFITVFPRINNSRKSIVVNQDGEATRYDMQEDRELTIDPYFSTTVSGEGEVTIGIDDDTHKYLTDEINSIEKSDNAIKVINGVTPKDGAIAVNVYYNGIALPVIKEADNWVIIDSSMFKLCAITQDMIDSILSPTAHSGYLPLDDLYDEDKVRNTAIAEEWEYGGFIDGNKISLFSIDTNIDGVVGNDGTE